VSSRTLEPLGRARTAGVCRSMMVETERAADRPVEGSHHERAEVQRRTRTECPARGLPSKEWHHAERTVRRASLERVLVGSGR
jgi:hypothetical protein